MSFINTSYGIPIIFFVVGCLVQMMMPEHPDFGLSFVITGVGLRIAWAIERGPLE